MVNARIKGLLYKLWRAFAWVMVFVIGLYVVPMIKKALYPEVIERMERTIHRTAFVNCLGDAVWENEVSLLVTIRKGETPELRGQVSKYVLKQLTQTDRERVFFRPCDQPPPRRQMVLEPDPDLGRSRSEACPAP